MRIIISPAKKMRVQEDWLEAPTIPVFENDADRIRQMLSGYDRAMLKELFRANDTITEQNYSRYREMDLTRAVTPALLAYVGLQYQSMAPEVFTQEQWSYVTEHLRILSGFYGILRSLDRVVPYRLEMQAKLALYGHKDLYGYWGSRLYDELVSGDSQILNLASKEYSKAVEPFADRTCSLVTCVFGEEMDGRVKVKATAAKMARGDMVSWLARERIREFQVVREYQGLGYRFSEKLSDDKNYVFVSRKNT